MDTFEYAVKVILGGFILVIIIILLADIKIVDRERDVALEKVKILTQQINDQNEAIQLLHDDQIKKQNEITIALKDAKKTRENYSKQAKEILAKNVSTDCNQAIKWGADQGSIIYRCWVMSC